MIKHFVVENFKSIEYLNIDCARINIFIGNPGSGKSNILEALGLLSHVYYSLKFGQKGSKPLRGFVRYKTLIDLFRDRMLKNKPRIMTDDVDLSLDVRDGSVVGSTSIRANGVSKELFVYTQIGELLRKQSIDFDVFRKYKFFRFTRIKRFRRYYSDELFSPNGSNLPEVLYEHGDLYQVIQSLIKNLGLQLIIRTPEFVLEFHKTLRTGVTVAFPYDVISDGIQNIIMHLAAIYSSKNKILIFEEPEIKTFPYFIKSLAERIARDNKNQYFISTHNPYFLASIIEKAPTDNIKIFITKLEKGKTQLHEIEKDRLREMMELDIDIFFNIEDFIGEE